MTDLVLIVGARPTGLTAALELSRMGVAHTAFWCSAIVCNWQILLQNSFCTGNQKLGLRGIEWVIFSAG
jgi:heterodisulfide reductase subunit A-like polyferredoxin